MTLYMCTWYVESCAKPRGIRGAYVISGSSAEGAELSQDQLIDELDLITGDLHLITLRPSPHPPS